MRIEVTPQGVVHAKPPLATRLTNLRRQLAVAARLTWFEVKARQFGRVLGLMWLILDPILFAGLYMFLVKVISASQDLPDNMFFGILTAVVVWRWFSRTVDNAPFLITSYGAIIKQTNFPLGVLITVFMGVEFFSFLLSFVVLLCILGIGLDGGVSWHVVWVPLIAVVQGVFMIALALLAAIVGAFLKDLGGFLYVFTSIWWYMSPGIYDPSWVSDKLTAEGVWGGWWALFQLNPFYSIFIAWKDVMVEHKSPDPQILALLAGVFVLSLLLLATGLFLLRRTRHHFFRVI